VNPLRRVVAWFKPRTKTPQDPEAAREAKRVRNELEMLRAVERERMGEDFLGPGSRF
jgi:hypothetical protein